MIPCPHSIICPEDQANKEVVFEKLQENSADYIFFTNSDNFDNLDIECGKSLSTLFKKLRIDCRYIKDIESCEKEISLIDPNKNSKIILIFGLSTSKCTYELLIKLTIVGYIREAKAKNEIFTIGDDILSFVDILSDEIQTVRTAAILTKRAIKKYWKTGILSFYSTKNASCNYFV